MQRNRQFGARVISFSGRFWKELRWTKSCKCISLHWFTKIAWSISSNINIKSSVRWKRVIHRASNMKALQYSPDSGSFVMHEVVSMLVFFPWGGQIVLENKGEDFLWRRHNCTCLVWEWYPLIWLKIAWLESQPQRLWFKYFFCHQWSQIALSQQGEECLHRNLDLWEVLLVWCHQTLLVWCNLPYFSSFAQSNARQNASSLNLYLEGISTQSSLAQFAAVSWWDVVFSTSWQETTYRPPSDVNSRYGNYYFC